MLLKFGIAGMAVTAFVVATALIPTDASAAGRSGPQPGTWNWPPHTEGPQIACGYVRVNPYPYKHRGQGRWAYQCR
jgi:hypothetical protein